MPLPRARALLLSVPASAQDQRLDLFLAASAELKLSRSQIQKHIEAGRVKVDGEAVKSKWPLKAGQEVRVEIPGPEKAHSKAEAIPLNIIFEDKEVLVINKPAGLVVHPGAGNPDGTLVNALLHHLGKKIQVIFSSERPGIVHRLDKDTSGCMVVAKTQKAFESLSKQIAVHSAGRTYQALAWGRFDEDEGSIDAPLGRSRMDRRKFAVRLERGKRAVTHFKVLRRYTLATRLELRLETGRTHQIRAHLLSIGRPIVGDPHYGLAPGSVPSSLVQALRKVIPRQALHAWKLEFKHPLSGKSVLCEAPIPKDFLDAEALLLNPPRN
jgi:23S rRNA pseudouridine1911/1915/1917 synthase